jgi:hypothetical protein
MTEHGDRRVMPRHSTPDEHGVVSARVRPGHDVSLLDLSAGGALVESDRRLSPGSSVELQLEGASRRTVVRGRVLRCSVAQVHADSICYRGAISFDRHLPWLIGDEPTGYVRPHSDLRRGTPEREAPTRDLL